MSKVQPLRPAVAPAPSFEGDVGAVRVEVHPGPEGAVVLRPPNGHELRIEIRGDAMSLRWAGPELRVEAPDGQVTLAGRNVAIEAEQTLSLRAGEEVDVHSRVDVDIRADHHVNLWGQGVLAGD